MKWKFFFVILLAIYLYIINNKEDINIDVNINKTQLPVKSVYFKQEFEDNIENNKIITTSPKKSKPINSEKINEYFQIIFLLDKKLRKNFSLIKNFEKKEDIEKFLHFRKIILNKNYNTNFNLIENNFEIIPKSKSKILQSPLIIKCENYLEILCEQEKEMLEKNMYINLFENQNQINYMIENKEFEILISDYLNDLIDNIKKQEINENILNKKAVEIINIYTYYLYDKNFMIINTEYDTQYNSYIKNNYRYGEYDNGDFIYEDKELRNLIKKINYKKTIQEIKYEALNYLRKI